MPSNIVVGKLKRAVAAGEIVRLSDFHDDDLITGVVRRTEDEQRRINKHVIRRKLEKQKKELLQPRNVRINKNK